VTLLLRMGTPEDNDFWAKGGKKKDKQNPAGGEGFWGAPGSDKPAEPTPSQPVEPEAVWSTAEQRAAKAQSQSSVQGGGEYWNKAEEKREQENAFAAMSDTDKTKLKKRRRRRNWLIGAGSLVVLLLLIVALAPTIAGWVAPGIVESQAAKQITGTVKVEKTSFGWFGSQTLRNVRLLDKEGKPVASLNVEVGKGLSGLVFGNLDVGTVTLRDVKADIIKYPDGTTNLQRAIAPRAPSAGKPGTTSGKKSEPKVPDSLNAKIVARKMQLTFTDLSRPGAVAGTPTAVLRDADLELEVGAGKPVVIAFDADAASGSSAAGKIDLKARADKLIRADGVIQADKATIDANLAIKSLPTALADAFVTLPENASVRQALGETLDATLIAKGNLTEATAQITAAAGEELRLNGDMAVAGGVLTTRSPLELFVSGRAVRALAPQVDAALKEKGTATIEIFPSVTMVLADLKLPMPKDGAALDLRGAGANVMAELGQTRGQVSLGEGRAPEAFTLAPLKAQVQAPDLSQGAKVTASTNAQLSGQGAGDVSVDLTVAGLLDSRGQPVKGPPGSLQGTVAIKRIATAVAQPFLAATKIDLPRDIGPTLDVELKAATQTAGVTAGQTPPTDVTIAVSSESLKVNGAMQLTQTQIRTTGEGISVQMSNPVGIASKFVEPSTGFALLPTSEQGRKQGLVITIKGVDVPRNAADGALQLDKAAAQLQVAVSGMMVAAIDSVTGKAQTTALAINNGVIGGELTPGGNAKATINLAMVYGGSPFTAGGAFDVPGAVVVTNGTPGLAPVERLRPVGQLDIKNVPSKLAGMFMKPAPAKPGEKPVDMAKLIADVLGDKVTVSVATAPVQETPETLNAAITMKSPTTTAEVNANVSKSALAVRKVSAVANVTPQTVTGLMAAFAPTVEGAPRLVGPAKINIALDPLTIPLEDYKPLLNWAGVANAMISIPGRTLVEGLQVANADGTKRDLGRVGIDSLAIGAKASVAALTSKDALPQERRATVTLGGTVIAQDDTLMELTGSVNTELSEGALAGGLNSSFSLKGINTKILENLAGKPGMISGAIGNTLTVGLTANLTPPAGVKGQAFDFKAATTVVELSLDAPRLHTDGPLAVTIAPPGVTLNKPVNIMMDVDPAWMNKFFEKPVPAGTLAGKPPPPDIQLTKATSLNVTIGRLSYPMPGGPGTMVMDAGLNVGIPQLQFRTSDGQAIRMRELVVNIDAAAQKIEGTDQYAASVPVNLKLDVAEAAVGDQPAAKAMTLRGGIFQLLNVSGDVTLPSAHVTLNGDLPAIPTALIDALAKQEGLLVDALGPVATVKLQVERYPLGEVKAGGAPPIIAVQAQSQRAKADLRGTIKDNVFHTERPLEVTLTEITEELAKRMIKGLPLMGTMSKSSKDAPALISGYNLTAPLGNDMTKLNGEFRIDPGEARFNTSTGFSKLLKMGGQQESGLIGQKLQPIVVRVVKGIATYEQWTLPLGEFEVKTEGTVNLVNRTVDVVTYVPFANISENAAGALNTSLTQLLGAAGGRVVNAATMVPIRTSGPMDKPETGIDTKLFVENIRKNLKPEDLLKEGIGDLLRDQLKPKPK